MATSIEPLNFEDGAQINVVKNDDAYTYVTSKIWFTSEGVFLEYTDGDLLRVFVPYHVIDRIYQEV
jgi:hypothetical protein